MILIKSLYWLGDSQERVREFAPEVRQRIGFELWEVQQGKEPADWKPVATIGPGVNEIRVHCKGEYRVLYVAKFAHEVYVLHAFAKKTRQIASRDITLAATRYRGLIHMMQRAQR